MIYFIDKRPGKINQTINAIRLAAELDKIHQFQHLLDFNIVSNSSMKILTLFVKVFSNDQLI